MIEKKNGEAPEGPDDRQDTAVTAAQALHAARAAQSAAARAGRAVPPAFLIAQGLTYLAGFTALGLAFVYEDQSWLLALGFAMLVAFGVLVWTGMRRGGTVPWLGLRRTRQDSWHLRLAPLLSLAAGGLAAIPYGPAGWVIGFGAGIALEHWLRAALTGRPW
ncbi:hypothetical protein [Streptomyces bobili]|uniref:hypothetical protein n=1 Tax=Streptomyces bobili TaxID=67280 RepID=UPI00380F70C5